MLLPMKAFRKIVVNVYVSWESSFTFFVELLLMLLIIYDFKLSILQESKSFWSYQ